MTTGGFLLLSFELCLTVVLVRVKAGVLTVKQGVWQRVDCMHLTPGLAVLAIPGRERVKVSLLVSGASLGIPPKGLGPALPNLGPCLREAGGGGAQPTGAVLAGVGPTNLNIRLDEINTTLKGSCIFSSLI